MGLRTSVFSLLVNMKLEIVKVPLKNGKSCYEYTLSEGPDGIEQVHGYATDLIVAFTKVLEWQERISRDYSEEITGELEEL